MLEQEKLIEAVKEKGQADPRLEAIWMYGSFTQGGGDAYSDVEFYLYVRDDALPGFNTEEWVDEVHPIYTCFFNEFGTQVVIFKNMVRGEFHVHGSSEMAAMEGYSGSIHAPDIDAMCLCDKTGELYRHLQALKGSAFTRSDEMVQSAVDNLLNNLVFGWSVFRRGEIARSHELLWYVQRYYLQLIRLAQNSMAHWINPTRWLEREVSEEIYSAYRKCTAKLDSRDIRNAYATALVNLRTVMGELRAQEITLRDYAELLSKLEQSITEDADII